MQAPLLITTVWGGIPDGKPPLFPLHGHGCSRPDWQANLTFHFHGCPDPLTPKRQFFLSPILIQVNDIATIFRPRLWFEVCGYLSPLLKLNWRKFPSISKDELISPPISLHVSAIVRKQPPSHEGASGP
jgi:hypothetical protein